MENVELGPVTTRVVHLMARLADRMQPQGRFKATPEMQLLAIQNEYRPANSPAAPIIAKPLSATELLEQDGLASIRRALYAGRVA